MNLKVEIKKEIMKLMLIRYDNGIAILRDPRRDPTVDGVVDNIITIIARYHLEQKGS